MKFSQTTSCAFGLALLGAPLWGAGAARAQSQAPAQNQELQNAAPLGQTFQYSIQEAPKFDLVFWELAGGMGVALEKADEVLLAQLGLPAGEGLVVRKVNDNSPASRAGIKPLDLIKSIDGKPLKNVDEAGKLFEAAEQPVTVDLIRQGKPIQVKVTPEKKNNTFQFLSSEPVQGIQSEFWVGVEVSPVDNTLRSHLGIPGGQGLVVTSVHQGSPAERAGVKANDILLSFGGKSLEKPADLVRGIKATGEKEVKLELIRAGKRLASDIKPERRGQALTLTGNIKTDLSDDLVVRLVRPGWVKLDGTEARPGEPGNAARGWAYGPDAASVEKRLEQVLQELKAVHRSLDDLQKAVKKD
jgi:membrane-associated protease RseP (regulator of RpoE activity)